MSTKRIIFLSLLIAFSINTAWAGIIIGGTRVIYYGDKKEASISVNNPDAAAYLIQSWIEPEHEQGGKAPFVLTPPLYRLDAGQQNVMRIVRIGSLPEDKESLFWLSVKAIPSATQEQNTLQIAVKTRIKLIYRPALLKEVEQESLPQSLIWTRAGSGLQVKNPSAFYINFNSLKVDGKEIDEATYIAPGQTVTYPLPAGRGAGIITFRLINDQGGVEAERKAKI